MPTPPLLDLDELLAPIREESPSGESLVYEPEYDAIRQARRSDDSSNVGVWQSSDSKVADWDAVVDLGLACLRTKSKDAQIAAWMAEALARRHGPAGLRDGLKLVRAIQESFWETYHPEIDDGDLESRLGPFVFLNGTIPPLLRSMPLTRGLGDRPFGFFDWKKSREIENDLRKNPDLLEEMKPVDRAALVRAEDFDTQVTQTPRAFYELLSEDLDGCLEAWKDLDTAANDRFGRLAPSLVEIKKAIEDLRKFLVPTVKLKREREPDAAPAVDEEIEEETEEIEERDDFVEDEPEAEATEELEPEPVIEAPRRVSRPKTSTSGPIADADEARGRILDAAEYLRRNRAESSAGYLVPRALRMADVFDAGESVDPAILEAPSSEARQSLRRLASDGEWEAALAQAEAAVSGPEGRGWLDAQRLAISAMEQGAGGDLSRPAAAAKALLGALLRSYPGLPDQELADGTPAANAETRAWLREQFDATEQPAHVETPAPPAYIPPPPDMRDAETSELDPWDLALPLAQAGRAGEGIQLLRRALNGSSTGRERFVRKLQMAELCLMAGHVRVALPLAEELARQVDDFRLEHWEDERLIARVWAALYRCLKALDPAPSERAQQAFTRLCRLDIDAAMACGDGGTHA
ncbi:type VI secretion system protein TssA [Isosphaeraceae bacterium EP7]